MKSYVAVQKKLLTMVYTIWKKNVRFTEEFITDNRRERNWCLPLWTAWYKLNKLVPGKLALNKVEYNRMIAVCLLSGKLKILKRIFEIYLEMNIVPPDQRHLKISNNEQGILNEEVFGKIKNRGICLFTSMQRPLSKDVAMKYKCTVCNNDEWAKPLDYQRTI